jgi:hypothetical protein
MTLYKITHKLTGKTYIGQTIQKLERRLAYHFSFNNRTSKSYIKSALQKHGKDAFSIDVIATYKTLEDLNAAEEYYIEFYNCLAPNGYNLHTGGNNHKPSVETLLKQSLSHLGKPNGRKGIKTGRPSWNKGIPRMPHCGFQKGHKSFISESRLMPVVCSNGKIYRSITEAAKELNTSTGKICAVIRGKRNHTKGFTFAYVEKKCL